MTRKILLFSLILLTLFALLACAPKAATFELQEDGSTAPVLSTVTVTGEGKLTVSPDKATLYVGVNSVKDTAEEATKANDQLVKDITQAILDCGVAQEDIKTTHFYLNEQWAWDKSKGIDYVTGYNAHTEMAVDVYDISQAGSVLDAAVAAGANNAHVSRFSLADPDAWEAELAKLAAQDATAQAQAYATALNMRLGDPVTVTTGDMGDEPMMIVDEAEAPAEEAAPEAEAGDYNAASGSSHRFSPGSMDLSTTVTIRFMLEK